MTDRKLFVPALAGVLGMGAIAAAAEPTAADLREQIDALQAKVAKIEAREAANQQATVNSVLNDAERRSQLLQSGGISAGYENGFFIQSANGAFKLQPNFQFQFRSVTNWADEAQDDGDANTENGFEVRRMKFGIKGNAFSKDLKYDFRLAVNRQGGSPVLDNAFVEYKFSDDWAVRAGQWKENVFHEETVSSVRQMAVERSLVNEALGGGVTDFVQGVALVYSSDALRGEIAFTDGANSDNTNYLDTESANYGGYVRAEYKVMGDWKNYDDFSAMKTENDLLVIGAGFDYTEGGSDHTVLHTIDAQYESGQLGLYAAYLGAWSEDGEDDTYNWGAVIQASYLIDSNWEVFGRFSYLDLEGATDELYEITAGANYYFYGHNAKATVDVVFLPEGSPSDSGLGYVASDDFQVVLRGQFQLAL